MDSEKSRRTGKEPHHNHDRTPPFHDPRADQILVVADNGIAESGTHEELLKKAGFMHITVNSEM